MKLFNLQSILLLLLVTWVTCSPIIKTEEKNIDKRGIGSYVNSISKYIFSKDIIRNVEYDTKKYLDVYYSKVNTPGTKRPVIVYICGGIWFLGEKTFYTKLSEYLNDIGYIAVVPNYAQFPHDQLDDMVYDVGNALTWVYNNIEEYGGDKENIIVIGHSSGAHVTALGLIKSSLGLKGIGENSITKPYPPLKKVIFLGGPFDFDPYSYSSRVKGETVENSKFEAFASYILGSEQSCPTDILKEYPDNSISYLGAEHFTIVHFSEDEMVPKSIALGLYEQMQRVGISSVDLYIAEGFVHTGVTEGVMEGKENAKIALYNIINH